MRNTINEILESINHEVYFLHCDSWHFKNSNSNVKIINCGVQEPNMINIATGLLIKNKTVIVYGIAGFVLEKCVEQFRLYFKNICGKFIFLEAGAHHEYPSNLGPGHSFGDNKLEYLLMYLNIFKIHDYYNLSKKDVMRDFNNIINSNSKCDLVLLGRDF